VRPNEKKDGMGRVSCEQAMRGNGRKKRGGPLVKKVAIGVDDVRL